MFLLIPNNKLLFYKFFKLQTEANHLFLKVQVRANSEHFNLRRQHSDG